LGGSAENRVSIEKRLKELGIARVVRLQGFVNATEEFDEHPQVLNGCSDLMVEVFGERGVSSSLSSRCAEIRRPTSRFSGPLVAFWHQSRKLGESLILGGSVAPSR
jgi:hypothetical protein